MGIAPRSIGSHGAHECARRCTQDPQQCREGWQAPGSHPSLLQGHRQVPALMQKHGYIGEFEIIDDHRSGKVVVELVGRINKCGVISPRFDLQLGKIEQWTSNLLPSRQFGYIVMTTSLGIMDHEEARRKSTGGKILGFFY